MQTNPIIKIHLNLVLVISWCSLCWISHSYFTSTQWKHGEKYEGEVEMRYHMGPVLASSPLNLYIIWYGHWDPSHHSIITDFLRSFSSPSSPSSSHPSVADWWSTVRLYSDQTGSNVTGNLRIAAHFHDSAYSHGTYLTRLSIQSVIRNAVALRRLPLNADDGLYLVLTSPDVRVQDFCRAVCGFHYFTFPTLVGATVPYAWVGHSGAQCPGMCAFPFASWPPPAPEGTADSVERIGRSLMKPPNGDIGADGMVSVIAHELAEVATNPLVNAWFAGEDPAAPAEIAHLCMGVYGSGGGGGYVGRVEMDGFGRGYNLMGVNGRRFLVQWVWNPLSNRCFGPNALD